MEGNNINCYKKIKQELINNETYKKVKDYSKNRNDLMTYYNVGKLLYDAGKHYGNNIIKNYSIRLTNELGKGYSIRNLQLMKKYYLFQKTQSLPAKLSWSHIVELLPLKDANKINYYINIVLEQNLGYRELRQRIKNKEYERLPDKTKEKLSKYENTHVQDFIKNPVIIDSCGKEVLKESILKQLILENITDFMKELGPGFSFIDSEYKIKIGNNYNYIDLLLFNIKYNCYVVIELKITELKKEHLGQISTYMHSIDKTLKTNKQDKTIGIIICKIDNDFIMEYCSDDRIFKSTYKLV